MDGDSFFAKHHFLADQVIRHLYDAFVIYENSNGRTAALFASPSFYRLTGFDSTEIIDQPPVFSVYRNGRLPDDHNEILHSITGSQFLEKDLQCLTRDNTICWVRAKSVPLESGSDRPGYHLLVLHEITYLKKKESELEKAKSTADYSAKIKERFLTNMSHEMRTPINAILGMAQLIEDTGLNNQQKDYLEELRLSSENLLAIINDILEFNLIESGGLKLNQRSFDIRKQLQLLADIMKERAVEKGLTFELVISDKVPAMVRGDVVRFSQVLRHLLTNAIKFTKYGGVSLTVRSGDRQGNIVPIEIRVKDTGIGIPPDLIGNVFDSFNRASRTTNYRFGGTGLGLSIASQITKHLGGTIDVESTEGSGSVFTVTIPFELPDTLPGGKQVSDSNDNEDQLKGKKILVVDDYMVNRKIVRAMLEKAGCLVEEAEDGEMAIVMVEDQNFDLVFMDVHMQGIDGLDVTRKIREKEAGTDKHLPVVAITASVLERDIRACMDAGMDDFIGKPFSKQELITAVITNYGGSVGNQSARFSDVADNGDDRINLKTLSDMADGDQDMIRDMLELFRTQTPVLMKNISEEIEKKDYMAAGKLVHTLKPTFMYMGLDRAYNIAADIESLTIDREKEVDVDSAVIIEKFSELKQLVNRSLKNMED